MVNSLFIRTGWYRLITVAVCVLWLIGPAAALERSIPFKVLADIESQAICFFKDSDGFIWIGTYVDGLYRFDGKNLKHYTKASGFILSNNIPAITQDRDGNLWFAAAGGGLSRYDKTTNTVRHFTHDPEDPASISSDSFFWAGKNSLCQDLKGNLWIGTIGGGLNRFEPENESFTAFRHNPDNPESIADDNIRAVLAGSKGQIWVGTEKGLSMLEPETGRARRFSLVPGNDPQKAQPMIMALCEDERGEIWIGTESDGLFILETDTAEYKNFRYHKDDPKTIASDRINHISQDRSGRLWITHATAVTLYDQETKTFTRPGGENVDFTMGFQHGDSALIWGLTDSGRILIHNPDGNVFRQFNSDPDDPNSLSSDIVISILEDSQGMIWISTLGGLNRYNPATETFTRFLHEPGNPESIPSKANYSPGIFEDDENVLWIGNSVPSALSRINKETGRVEKSWYPDPSDPATLPDAQQINRMIQDKDDPRIMWIATAKGLARFDKRTEVFRTFGRNNSWHLLMTAKGLSG